MGYKSAEGYLFLADRAKDMVIRGGENIYPAEIENYLLELEGVQEVAAFGLPHERLGEELAVTVVTRPGAVLDEAAVLDFCRANFASFKVPSRVLLQTTPLPRNATNKVLKKQIREAALAKI
jgi:acyl-CoA synthetase (AMP-forming)/AMP-acid ligase II